MSRLDRAKQFMPFDALKGLREALAEREERRTRVERKEISEELIADISAKLSRLQVGDSVRVRFFSHGHYLDVESTVDAISSLDGYITLGKARVYFEDIIRMEII